MTKADNEMREMQSVAESKEDDVNEPKNPMVVRCNWCLAILTEPGALVFTPPDEVGRCNKVHVCVGCYARVMRNEGMV